MTLKSLVLANKILITIPSGFLISILLLELFLMIVPSLNKMDLSLLAKVVKIVES